MPKDKKGKSKDKKGKSKDKKGKSSDKKSKSKGKKSSKSSVVSEKPITPNSDAAQGNLAPVMCVMHKGQLTYFCETCEDPVCQLCITLGPHNNQVSLKTLF